MLMFPHCLRADINGTIGYNIENWDPGDTAACEFRLRNGVSRAAFVHHGVNFTNSGPARADGAMLDGGGVGGLTLASRHPDAGIWFDTWFGSAGYVSNGMWYFARQIHIHPGSSVTPYNNGDITFEFTNDTTLTFKAKGSDGVVRSASLTLA